MLFTHRFKWVKFLFVASIVLVLTSCGSKNEFTYRVSGEGTSKASISYADAEGNTQEEQVELPWEITIGVGNNFSASVDVTNGEPNGTVTCEIWLGERMVGKRSSAAYAKCFDAFSKSGNSIANSFTASSVEVYLSNAQKYIDEENYDKALEEVERAFEVAPDYFGCYMVRAVVYEKMGDLEAAKADVLKVQELNTDQDAQAWVEGKLKQYSTGSASVTKPEIDGHLAFVSKRNESVDIYSINVDGSDEQLLTEQLGVVNNMPVWSPDGKKIAFMSTRDGNKDIYVMDSDGGNVQRITDHPAVDQMPVWSPKSNALAFVSERNGNADILIYNLEKEELTQLTKSPSNEWDPTWSPNTPELAYVSDADGDPEIYVINADLEIRQLTDNEIGDSVPAWSPDGRWIAFVSTADGKNSDLFAIYPNGENMQQITSFSGLNTDPAWSPDSKLLAFASDNKGDSEIYVIDMIAGKMYQVTDNDFVDAHPTWGPSVKP